MTVISGAYEKNPYMSMLPSLAESWRVETLWWMILHPFSILALFAQESSKYYFLAFMGTTFGESGALTNQRLLIVKKYCRAG